MNIGKEQRHQAKNVKREKKKSYKDKNKPVHCEIMV